MEGYGVDAGAGAGAGAGRGGGGGRAMLARRPSKRRRKGRLERGQPWRNHRFNALPPEQRKNLIRQPWRLPVVAYNLAAITIQKMVRAWLVRRRAAGVPSTAAPEATTATTTTTTTTTPRPRPRAVLMAKFLAEKKFYKDRGVDGGDELAGFDQWLVARVQSWWRMVLVRTEFTRQRFSLYHVAAMQIQNLWRAHLHRIHVAAFVRHPDPLENAVTIIQRAYRRFYFRLIFRHFRDLLAFKNTGDPVTMLRSVNPREAALLDPAAGVRVRFRLGGASFPPTVYYKLFCSAPVCDLGSFAPRDYTDPTDRPPRPTELFNKSSAMGVPYAAASSSIRVGSSSFSASVSMPMKDATAVGVTSSGDGERLIEYVPPDSWYRRDDNNGWRAVTTEALEEGGAGAPKKPAVFHHNRGKRRVDAILAKKRRKREWMMKMYKEGLAKERTGTGADDDEVVDFDSEHWEEAADDLLQWSEALDFDNYMASWKSTATSAHVRGTNIAQLCTEDSLDELKRTGPYGDARSATRAPTERGGGDSLYL